MSRYVPVAVCLLAVLMSIGCGQGAGTSPTAPPVGRARLYVHDVSPYDSRGPGDVIRIYDVDEAGDLTLHGTWERPSDDHSGSSHLTTDPGGRFLFDPVSLSSNVTLLHTYEIAGDSLVYRGRNWSDPLYSLVASDRFTYAIGEHGFLYIGAFPLGDVASPAVEFAENREIEGLVSLALPPVPAPKALYAVEQFGDPEQFQVVTYALDAEGSGTRRGAVDLSADGREIVVAPAARFVYATTEERPGGKLGLQIFAIGADGTLAPAGLAPGVSQGSSAWRYPSALVFHPSGRLLVASVLPGPSGDGKEIGVYRVDPQTGQAALVQELDDEVGIQGLAFHPSGRYLYGTDFNGRLLRYTVDVDAAQLRDFEVVGTGLGEVVVVPR